MIESPRLVCLGFDWSVESDDPALVRSVTSLYDACVATGSARHRFGLRHADRTDPSRLTLSRDGSVVLENVPPGLAVARLVWEVNRGVVEESTGHVLLHAAAAEREGSVVLLAGPSRAGKSTLVAALVRAELRYVTDETVAIDPASAGIVPYPKPIGLERGSWPLLPDLRPDAEAGGGEPEQWLVPPRSIRADAVAPSGGVASLVLFPAHRPGHPTKAQPIARAEAAVALAEHSFNFRSFGPGALDVIARVLRTSRCFRLEVGDLDDACRLVLDLLEPAAVEG